MEAVVWKEGSLPEGPSADSPAPRLRIGDHLVSPRQFTSHHGIYVGNGQVVHYAGLAIGLQAGPVKVSSVEEFLAHHSYTVREYKTRTYSREESVEMARARIGEDLYHPAFNNCEHFVTWCITGKTRSSRLTCSSVLLAALGVCFSAAQGRCCMRSTEGYAAISRDRINRLWVRRHTSRASCRVEILLRAQNAATLDSRQAKGLQLEELTKPMPTGWQEQRSVPWSAITRWTRPRWRHVASTAPTSSGRRSFARGGTDSLNPAALSLFLLDHLPA